MPGLSLPEQTPPTEGFVDICQSARDQIRTTRSLSFFSYSPGSQLAGMGKTSSYRGPSAISTLSTSPTIIDTLKMTPRTFGPSGLSLAITQTPGISKPSALSMAFAQSPAAKAPLSSGSPSPILLEKDQTIVDDSCIYIYSQVLGYLLKGVPALFECNFFRFQFK